MPVARGAGDLATEWAGDHEPLRSPPVCARTTWHEISQLAHSHVMWKACLLLFVALLVPACASFSPKPLEEVPFLEGAVEEQRDGLTVRVAVPSAAETKKIFGVDLAKKQIQPIWISIVNDTGETHWLMRHGVDPNYFSAREAAYMAHFTLRPGTNRKMDDHFAGLDFDPSIEPHSTRSGFAFSNLKLGTKEVRIRLFSEQQVEDFHFYVSVPGLRADWQAVDFRGLYDEEEIADLQTEEELYEVLSSLPCCTTRKDGSGQGDPLNIVVIGDRLLEVFVRAGWDETELLTAASSWRTFKAFFGGEYKHSPMSALYVFGRPQDAGLQKARDSIHQRNHLRLWVGPWSYRGKSIWVGSITRDIGVYFTTRAWNLTTHAIDPNVDEARDYLTEDLATAQRLEKIGHVPGVGPASQEEPHRNLMWAPWWTDGHREAYLISDDDVPLDELRFFEWVDQGEEASSD